MESIKQAATLEDMVREVAQPLLRYLERHTGDRALAEDMRQETLIRIARGWSSFAGRSALKTWAFAIARRVLADHYRTPGHRVHAVDLDEALELADPAAEIDARAIRDQANECVRQVIDALPDPYRMAIILHDLEECSVARTAEISECTVATAKIRIHRARARLKQTLSLRCAFYHDSDGVYRCDRKA